MPLIEELLNPISVTVGLILSLILALFIYFRQAMDSLNKDLSIISERLARLELEIGYRKELNDLRKDYDELHRKLSNIQKEK